MTTSISRKDLYVKEKNQSKRKENNRQIDRIISFDA